MTLLWLSVALAADPAADRVFFLVIDGMRDEEGVLGTDTNLPHLWDELRPTGAYAFPLQNRDATLTDAAHRSIMAGRRGPMPGLPWYPGRDLQRVWSPTLAEVVGNARGGGGYVIGNTVFLDSQGRSLAPGYRGGTIREASTEANSTASDDDIYAQLLAELGADDRVVLYNIHEADKSGHADKWDGYIAGLQRADSIVDDLVHRVGTARDTFFVFSDHGRHRDETWMGHGDDCTGCRQSWLLAFGAGIRAGVEVSTAPEIIDLAPTAAWLTGAPMPSTRGRVLAEILVDPPAEPADADALVEPALAVDGAGTTFEVARRLPHAADDGALVMRSRPAGGGWTAWTTFAEEADSPEMPSIAAGGGVLWRAWRTWQIDTGNWGIVGEASADGGTTWASPVRLARAVQYYEAPRLVGADAGFAATWWADARASADAPATLHTYAGTATAWIESEVDPGDVFHAPTEPTSVYSTSAGPLSLFAAIPSEHYDPPQDGDTTNPGDQDRDLWLLRGVGTGSPGVVRVTQTDDVEYWPALTESPEGQLVAAWAHRAGPKLADGAWDLRLATSADHGVTWSDTVAVESPAEAWKPVLVSGPEGTWMVAVEVEGATQTLAAYAVVDGKAERRATLATSTGWIDELSAVAVADGLQVAWTDGVDTNVHHIGDVLAPWASLAAKEDTGKTPAPPDDPCGCSHGSGLLGLGLPLLWVRRRRAPTLVVARDG